MLEPDDHDQRFKSLLQEFLPEFVALFFPTWADRFEFSRTEWLEQEAFLDPPEGERRVLDLVAKVPTTVPVTEESDDYLLLIHIEIDSSESTTLLRKRMLQYYAFLRRSYGLGVFPIALFLRVGHGGIGRDVYEETLWGKSLIRYEYFSIGLPALDGNEYRTGSNLLGLALSALMKLPPEDRARILAEGLERIELSGENELRKYLLADCFDHYFPASDSEREEAHGLMAERFNKGGTIMNGLELRELRGERRGELRGELRGKCQIVVKQLTKRFGPLPEAVLAQLNAFSSERLDEIALAFTEATSLAELGLGDSPTSSQER